MRCILLFVWIASFSLLKAADTQVKGRNVALENSQELLQKADQWFNAGVYERAIPLYSQLLEKMTEGTYPKTNEREIRYWLACAYYLTKGYQNALQLIEKDFHPDSQHLLGCLYHRLNQLEMAIESLNRCLADRANHCYDEALYEKSLCLYELHSYEKAIEGFKSLQNRSERLRRLSTLYLAKIYLETNCAQNNCHLGLDFIPKEDVLHFEAAYLLGESYFRLQNYPKAIFAYEKALPSIEKAIWHSDAIYRLALSYIKMAEELSNSPDASLSSFDKAETLLKQLLESPLQERAYLALGQLYLSRAALFHDTADYSFAVDTLAQGHFNTSEAQAQALLLSAQAAGTYEERDRLYRQLTHERHQSTPYYAKGWFHRGLNDLEEAQRLLSLKQQEEAAQLIENAIFSLEKASDLLQKTDPTLARQAFKQALYALNLQNHSDQQLKALAKIEKKIGQEDNADELLYLKSLIAARMAEVHQQLNYFDVAEQTLQKIVQEYPQGQYADQSLLLLGTLSFKKGNPIQAKELFLRLSKEYPNSALAGDALFWAARSYDAINDPLEAKNLRKQVYENYPQSAFAADAYFFYYTFSEYLQGDRQPMKHLELFPKKYPNSPHAITAWHLIGLDYKRDRKTAEGKWIRKKNLTAAIDSFQEAESAYERLSQQKSILESEKEYFFKVRCQAILERALCNLAIADESSGAKQQIYLEYGEQVLTQLIPQIEQNSSSIADEAAYALAQTYAKAKKEKLAEDLLDQMLEKYRSAKITRGFYLSRIWHQKGLLAMGRQQNREALKFFTNAEEAAKGRVLNTEQRLDLWLLQSHCYRCLQDYDYALLSLSKVINDDSISGLRLKAMYQRAEIYELQERRELARRQLDALSKKGVGEWSIKAKTKLETDYGY